MAIHSDRLETTEQGKRLFLIHGDGLSPADWKYRAFVRFPLRNRVAIALYRLLPPDLGIPLAKAVSSRSRNHTSGRQQHFLKDYETFAEKKLGEGYDAVIIAHTHEPAFKRLAKGIYLNTGDFYSHFSYGRLAGGILSLESYA
jgi:UDP-2,3-diacylglucosamine pyrophosphatase LpxH